MLPFQKTIDATDRTISLSFTNSSQPIQVAVGDLSGISISVSGTWTGAIAFEGSVSGTDWGAIDVYLLSDNSKSATITATDQYGINTNAFSQIKIVPTVSSGIAVVEMLAATSSPLIVLAGGGGETINVSADPSKAPDSTVTSIASSATSQVILAANSLRKTVIIANDSTAILYLKLNPSAASTSSYSHALAPLASGIPATVTLRGEDYSGEITGIWSAANGNARVTETF